MEPDDAILASAMHKAEIAEHKAMEQRKHKFRGGGGGSGGASGATKRPRLHTSSSDSRPEQPRRDGGGEAIGRKLEAVAKTKTKAPLLSFGDDDGDGE